MKEGSEMRSEGDILVLGESGLSIPNCYTPSCDLAPNDYGVARKVNNEL